MSTHAITWFNDEDVLGMHDPVQAMTEPPTERRWSRTKIDCRARVTYTLRGQAEVVDGQGNDVSEGGMSVYVPAEIGLGEMISVELVRRYGKARVIIATKVTNRNGFRYGLEFANIEEEQRIPLVASIIGAAQ